MKKLLNAIVGFLGFIALLLLFVCILSLVVFFLFNFELFGNFKNILVFISESFLGGLFAAHISKKITNGIKEYGSLSKSLQNFLVKEPLIHASIWVLIVVQFVLFTYYLPIHSVQIIITGNHDLSGEYVEVILNPQNVQISQCSKENGNLIYQSDNFLRWGDSVKVDIKAKGYLDYSTQFGWSGYSFLNLIEGNPITVNLQSSMVKLEFRSFPENAQIRVRTENIDSAFFGLGAIDLLQNTQVELNVSANNFSSVRKNLIVKKDTSLVVNLWQLTGILIIRAYNEGNEPQSDMDIYINNKITNFNIGEEIKLSPATYKVYLKKKENELLISVPEFKVDIFPNQKVEKNVTVEISRR